MRRTICLLVLFIACVSHAGDEKHWAFVPPQSAGDRATLDSLLAAEREKAGVIPQGAADARLWLRRVYLDLTGLPPSLEELAAFEKDHSTSARGRVVDRLLSSPQYGERWGRHFMDIWRYTDWFGLGDQLRYSQKHIWHWRDWIVESLNSDKRYDRMVQEMLAGDELEPLNNDVLRATGFLARNYYLFNRTTWLDEVVEHTSKSFLGLTMNCVKCHAHKYDPFGHEEYYAMRAIFEPYHVRLDALPGQPDLEKDGLPRVYDLHLQQATYVHTKGDEKQPMLDHAVQPDVPAVLRFAPLAISPVTLPRRDERFIQRDHVAAAQAELAAAEAKAASKPESDTLMKAVFAARMKLHAVQASLRKSPLAKDAALALTAAQASAQAAAAEPTKKKAAEEACRKAVANLGAGKGEPLRIMGYQKALEGPDEGETTRYLPPPATSSGRRLAFARWITDARNPLTARVIVNHVWLRHFGQPLVANVFDFGKQSKAPALQKVLDHLAVDFMNNGWSLKHLHRRMVLSDTYAMTSSSAGAVSINRERDPENKLYWRMNAARLDSHTLRDALLQLSGRLELKMGGPTINTQSEDKVPRRSLYFNQTRDEVSPFLEVFDNPSVADCYRRAESIVPQQALAMMNAATALRAANGITARLKDRDDAAFVKQCFMLILATEPTEEELRLCLEALATTGGRPALVHTLLNHQDFLTVR